MPDVLQKRQGRLRTERLQAILAEPETLTTIMNHICEGGSLITLAKAWDVRYAELYAWVHDRDHPARLEKYAVALEGRKAYFTESIAVRLHGIQEADLSQCYDDKGNLLPMKKWPENVRRALSVLETSISEDGDVTKKLKLSDPLRAMELLGKYVKMFTERVEHTGGLTLEALVGSSMAPPKGVPAVTAPPQKGA